MKKLIGSLLLAGFLTVVAVGCGDNTATKSGQTKTVTTGTSSTTTTHNK